MKKGLFISACLVGSFLFASAVFAQAHRLGEGGGALSNQPRKSRLTNTFGTTDTYYRVSSFEFTGLDGAAYRDNGTGGQGVNRYTTIALGALVASLHLPSGAMIDYVELDSCEFNAGFSTSMALFDCDYQGDACSLIPGTNLFGTDNLGSCSYTFNSPTPYGPINNGNREYLVEVTTPAGDGSESLSGVIVGYRIQVSPAPTSATFLDVPTTSPIFRFVEALAASGITAGCDATHYCPNASLTRGQMAVYLATAL